MRKTWILDTETKGTGAHVVPYEKTRASRQRERDLALVELGGPSPSSAPAPERRVPARFRIVDVLSSQVVAEGVDLRETVTALEGMRSALDAIVSVWVPSRERWRMLTFDERRALWELRGRLSGGAEAPEQRGSGARERRS